MKELRYYSVPLQIDGISNDAEFIKKAEELGYSWNCDEFKEALNSKKLNIQGMWIKVIATERI